MQEEINSAHIHTRHIPELQSETKYSDIYPSSSRMRKKRVQIGLRFLCLLMEELMMAITSRLGQADNLTNGAGE